MHISTLNLWKDIGYTDGSITQPPLGINVLPSPDLTFSDLHVGRDRLFSQLKLRVPYLSAYDCNYLQAVFSTGEGDKTFFGWIDKVSCLSDVEDSEECLIDWHVDYWRTFKDAAVFKEGVVIRKPSTSGGRPVQNCPYKFKMLDTAHASTICDHPIYFDSVIAYVPMWLYFSYTDEDANHQVTSTRYGCFPIYRAFATRYYKISDDGGSNTHETLSVDDVVSGVWDERLKIDPTRIKYAGLLPAPPGDVTGIWEPVGGWGGDSVVSMTVSGWTAKSLNSSNYYFFSFDHPAGDLVNQVKMTKEFENTYASPFYTGDEKSSVVILGHDFEKVATLPPFRYVSSMRHRTVLSTTGAYTQIRFDCGNGNKAAHSEGLCVNIPAITVENTENSWSQYVYSGQREYDRAAKELQARSAAIESTMSSLGLGASLGSGQAFGAAGGSAAAGLAGGAAGALTYGAFQAVGAGLSYAVKEGILNPEMQGLQDRAHAKQTDNLLLPGAGFDSLGHGSNAYTMATEFIDDYSAGVFNNDISVYGVHCQEATSNCQTLIAAGGPMAITGLDVGGDIPSAAKNFISEMFGKGVRLL